jgi:hypothetical protein
MNCVVSYKKLTNFDHREQDRWQTIGNLIARRLSHQANATDNDMCAEMPNMDGESDGAKQANY